MYDNDDFDPADDIYPRDPVHRPRRGVPIALKRLMEKHLGKRSNWLWAGHAFGSYIASQWPKNRAFDDLYQPLDILHRGFPDHGEIGWRLAFLLWLHTRYPDVIASIPPDKLMEFNEGAYRKLCNYACWDSPVLSPEDAS